MLLQRTSALSGGQKSKSNFFLEITAVVIEEMFLPKSLTRTCTYSTAGLLFYQLVSRGTASSSKKCNLSLSLGGTHSEMHS